MKKSLVVLFILFAVCACSNEDQISVTPQVEEINFFRVKTVDFDGSFEYTTVYDINR